MNWFKKLFKKKESLRDKCIAAYGEEFGECYDAINRGEAIGGFAETCTFLDMLEAVKKGKPINLNNPDENKKSDENKESAEEKSDDLSKSESEKESSKK